MKGKFGLGEEVYVKARVVGTSIVNVRGFEVVAYTVETTENPIVKIFELRESNIERRVQQ